MLTPPVRANARYNGCWGFLCLIVCAVLLYGGWAMYPQAGNMLETGAYVASIVMFAAGFFIAAAILVAHWLRTEADCDGIDANTRAYDPYSATRYITVDDPNGHTGAIHYDGEVGSYPVSVDGEHFILDSQGNLTKEE